MLCLQTIVCLTGEKNKINLIGSYGYLWHKTTLFLVIKSFKNEALLPFW